MLIGAGQVYALVKRQLPNIWLSTMVSSDFIYSMEEVRGMMRK